MAFFFLLSFPYLLPLADPHHSELQKAEQLLHPKIYIYFLLLIFCFFNPSVLPHLLPFHLGKQCYQHELAGHHRAQHPSLVFCELPCYPACGCHQSPTFHSAQFIRASSCSLHYHTVHNIYSAWPRFCLLMQMTYVVICLGKYHLCSAQHKEVACQACFLGPSLVHEVLYMTLNGFYGLQFHSVRGTYI